MVTGDSQEEVIIFRYKQTDRHFIIIYISATVTTLTSFELASSKARVTSIKFTKQESVSELVSELVTRVNNDRTRVR